MREPLKDKKSYHAVIYNIMIIGEAAYKLSREFVAPPPEVSWQVIADMRHHLVHGYYQVDSGIVWDVIKHDLEPLRDQIRKLLTDTDWELWEQK